MAAQRGTALETTSIDVMVHGRGRAWRPGAVQTPGPQEKPHEGRIECGGGEVGEPVRSPPDRLRVFAGRARGVSPACKSRAHRRRSSSTAQCVAPPVCCRLVPSLGTWWVSVMCFQQSTTKGHKEKKIFQRNFLAITAKYQ